MDRKEFLQQSVRCALGAGGLALLGNAPACCAAAMGKDQLIPIQADNKTEQLRSQLRFVMNWVSDLLGAMDKQLDEATYIKLMDACGQACYHRFKEFITREAKGNMDKLVELYGRWVGNPENVRRRKDRVEIEYKMPACTCAVSYVRPPKPDEKHCYCSVGSLKAIFSTVAGKPVTVDLVKSIRRGDDMCKFVVHLA
jgi:predicted hydrocarbon binding protein